MTDSEIKLILLCFFFGGGFALHAIRRIQSVRQIQDAARSRVATAAQGFVEFEGFAWPAHQGFQNAVGDETVFYSIEVERLVSRGSGSSSHSEWKTVFSRRFGDAFYLVDPTGLALVDPASSELDTDGVPTREWQRLSADEKKRVAGIVGDSVLSFPPSDFCFGIFAGRYRIREQSILVGSPLYARGDLRALGIPPPRAKFSGLTEFTSRIFDLNARTIRNVDRLLDRNRDGKVTAEERRRGYAVAANLARAKANGTSSEEREFEIFGRLGSSDPHRLFIADCQEGDLVARLNRFVLLQFIAGAALIAVGAALISPHVILHPRVTKTRKAVEQPIRLPANVPPLFGQ